MRTTTENTSEASRTNESRKAWIDYLQGFTWEWFITLRFRGPATMDQADHMLRRWIRKLTKEENIQAAGIAIVSQECRFDTHIHCLLTSKQTSFNKTLSTVNGEKWEKLWDHGPCIIIPSDKVVSQTVFIKYFAKEKNLSLNNPDAYQLISFKPGLLNRLQEARKGPISAGTISTHTKGRAESRPLLQAI